MKFNIKKLRITPGSTFEAKSGQVPPGVSALDMIDEGFYALTGLRLPLSCCATTLPTNGQALTWDSVNNKLTFTTLSGGGAGTNISLGTITSTVIPLVSSTGTGVILPSATTTLAGLMSAADKVKVNSLIGTNSGDVTVTDSNSIDFTLTGQNITAIVSGASTATIGQIPASNGTGGFTWVTLISKERLDYIDPTALNTVPNLTAIPADSTKVKFYVNGVLVRGITCNALGVVTVNFTTLGYNVDITDEVTANYFV